MILNFVWAFVAAVQPQNAVPPVPKKFEPGKNVVLVHGILDRHISMFYIRKRLEKEGYRCVVPSLAPNDARLGLADLSEKLGKVIDESFKPGERFSIVAFSMGGLVSRHYLLNRGGARRCDRFVTISTPHHGTLLAYCYPGKGTREMRPKSQFLAELQERDGQLKKVRCFSYRTPMDLIILPASSSKWDLATNRVMMCPLHPLMVLDKNVAAAVVEDLKN